MKPAATPELLAPAGNLETAFAAYDAGADAVYCGLGKFNARERAQNFTPDSLARLLDYAHGRGRKLYLTLNTLVKETELSEVAAYLAELAKLRPDALIVQDLGVLNLAREYFPSLVLHASTQMGIHNSAGVAAAARLGIRRVILERQVTLDELRKIAARSTLELEVFIHGSLCCSLSGQCLLSSALGGWSGNRGKCKQPCRRIYDAAGRSGFLLSPRDLYGVPLLPELRRIGVASLKIEGRLRSPDYVWKTVKAYRLLLDGPVDSPPELLLEAEKLLRSTATRRPSNGFYFANEYSSLIDAGRLGSFGVAAAKVGKYARAGLSVTALERLHLGDRLRLVPPEGGEGESFTLIDLRFQGKSAVKVRAGANCFIPGGTGLAALQDRGERLRFQPPGRGASSRASSARRFAAPDGGGVDGNDCGAARGMLASRRRFRSGRKAAVHCRNRGGGIRFGCPGAVVGAGGRSRGGGRVLRPGEPPQDAAA